MNVISRQSEFCIITGKTDTVYFALQKRLLRICLFNFFLLALIGLLLRAYPIFHIPFFTYKNVLHAHSHFAFGGWVIPVLLFLILKFFPEIRTAVAYHHWRNSIVLMLVSAYGMFLSFPFQGYGAVSIVFSTLSIAAGFYSGIIIRNEIRQHPRTVSHSFLLAGFFYYFLSAAGPLATGPLIAMGKAGSAIYYNAIYFYLHFQYNGFFTFIVLALLYKMIEQHQPVTNGKIVFRLLSIACIPAYFLSVLWTQPSIILYVTGGAAALLQVIAVIWLLKDIKGISWKNDLQRLLFRIAIFAFVVKNVLQLLSAFPSIAELAYQNRNFIIAYLHLVLLGFVSVFVFAAILKSTTLSHNRLMYSGILFFLFAFITTELLLVLQAGGYLSFIQSSIYLWLLFGLSSFFPVGLLLVWISCPGRILLRA